MHKDTATPARQAHPGRYWVLGFIILQAGIALRLGLPGHLSIDSLVQLYEADTGQSISFNPPLMSVLLGWFSASGSAPIVFVVLMQALVSACIWLILTRSRSLHPLRLALAFVVLLNPVIMIYTGIVWKDVLLAHTAGCLFIVLASLPRFRAAAYWRLVALSLVLMVLTLGSRQQGVLYCLAAAIALAWMLPVKNSLKPLAFITAAVIVFLLTDAVQSQLAPRPGVNASAVGLRKAIQFDLAGIVANDGQLSGSFSPVLDEEITDAATVYSPYRVDTITTPASQVWGLPLKALGSVWFSSVLANPAAYMHHRLDHFAALAGFRERSLCLPVHVGVTRYTHPELAQELSSHLGYAGTEYPHAQFVFDSVLKMLSLPIYAHWFYAVVTLLATVYLFYRREYVAGLYGLCSTTYVLSFLVVSIACDFRYLYTSVFCATMLTAYCLALPRRDRIAASASA